MVDGIVERCKRIIHQQRLRAGTHGSQEKGSRALLSSARQQPLVALLLLLVRPP